MTSEISILWLVVAGIVIVALRLFWKHRRGLSQPSIDDEEFLHALREQYPEVNSSILNQRRRVALALSVPYSKLDPSATRQDLIDTYGLLGDVSFGWGDLEEELADELGKDSGNLEIETVADFVLGFHCAEFGDNS